MFTEFDDRQRLRHLRRSDSIFKVFGRFSASGITVCVLLANIQVGTFKIAHLQGREVQFLEDAG